MTMSEENTLEQLIAEYDAYLISHAAKGNAESDLILGKGKPFMSHLLKELRKSNCRRPDIVVACGKHLLSYENSTDGKFATYCTFAIYTIVSIEK